MTKSADAGVRPESDAQSEAYRPARAALVGFTPPFEVYNGSDIGDVHGHVASGENEEIARSVVLMLNAFAAIVKAGASS